MTLKGVAKMFLRKRDVLFKRRVVCNNCLENICIGLFSFSGNVFANPISTDMAEDKMMSMIIILMRNMKNPPRKGNVRAMATVGCIPFVTGDWEYVLAE